MRQFENVRNLKPVKKSIFFRKKVKKHRIEKALWLFPNISSQSSWRIVKEVLGAKFYPHFLRLNLLTQTAMNDPTATVVTLKSVRGIRSLSALENILEWSKRKQRKPFLLRKKGERLAKRPLQDKLKRALYIKRKLNGNFA